MATKFIKAQSKLKTIKGRLLYKIFDLSCSAIYPTPLEITAGFTTGAVYRQFGWNSMIYHVTHLFAKIMLTAGFWVRKNAFDQQKPDLPVYRLRRAVQLISPGRANQKRLPAPASVLIIQNLQSFKVFVFALQQILFTRSASGGSGIQKYLK